MIERSLVLVKHDGVSKGLIGEVIKRIEQIGLKIIGMKMICADEKLAENHYNLSDEWVNSVGEKTRKNLKEKGIETKETNLQIAKRIQTWNKQYLMEGPVVAIVFEGPHSVEIIRKIVGHTEPRQALPGTIRGDLALESYALQGFRYRNLIHRSGTKDEAEREINLWFSEDEIYSYETHHDKHIR